MEFTHISIAMGSLGFMKAHLHQNEDKSYMSDSLNFMQYYELSLDRLRPSCFTSFATPRFRGDSIVFQTRSMFETKQNKTTKQQTL